MRYLKTYENYTNTNINERVYGDNAKGALIEFESAILTEFGIVENEKTYPQIECYFATEKSYLKTPGKTPDIKEEDKEKINPCIRFKIYWKYNMKDDIKPILDKLQQSGFEEFKVVEELFCYLKDFDLTLYSFQKEVFEKYQMLIPMICKQFILPEIRAEYKVANAYTWGLI